MKIKIVKDIDKFLPVFNTDSIIIPILEKADLVILFVYIDDILYVLNFWHDDLHIKLPLDDKLLSSTANKYVYNKERLSNILPLQNIYEMRLFYYLSKNKTPDEIYNNGRKHYDNLYGDLNNNYIMPFTVLTDYAYQIIKYHKDIIFNNLDLVNTESFIAYNSIYLTLSNHIRNNKIIANDKHYSLDYNFYTTTGRPVLNKHKQFFSITDNSDFKKSIISRYNDGLMLYYDYTSSHMFILSDILGIELTGDPYTYFGKILLDKDEITAQERDDIKKILFSVLYRESIPSELFKIEFFNKVNEFADILYGLIQKQGYYETHFFKKKIYKESLSKNKKNIALNYYILSYETERNVILLNKVIKYIKDNNLKTKLVLYVYDGFLFDYSISDGRDIVKKIREIMEDNKYPIGLEYGLNFNDLTKIGV